MIPNNGERLAQKIMLKQQATKKGAARAAPSVS
jgi:hypothetical protein